VLQTKAVVFSSATVVILEVSVVLQTKAVMF